MVLSDTDMPPQDQYRGLGERSGRGPDAALMRSVATFLSVVRLAPFRNFRARLKLALRGSSALLFVVLLTPTHSIHVAHPTVTKPRLVAALGDSITSGYGLDDPLTQSWPSQAGVLSHGEFRFANYGISGDRLAAAAGPSGVGTSMQNRLAAVLKTHPWTVVLLGGANDVGHIPATEDERTIRSMARQVQRAGAHLLVVTITPIGSPTLRPMGYDAFAQSLNRWIISTFPHTSIDYWRYLSGGRGNILQARFDSGDGIHPDATAARWLAQQVLARLAKLT